MAKISSDDAWAPLLDRFVGGHYGPLRGRFAPTSSTGISPPTSPPPPLRIVDLGGGAGHQSIPLARLGYDVTIVDPSPAMLDMARETLAAEGEFVAGRVQLVQAFGEGTPRALGEHRYGAVLCHDVVMYLGDPRPLVDALCALVTPGGIVSIVAKNVEALACRPALAGNGAEALAAFDADRQVNGLGMEPEATASPDSRKCSPCAGSNRLPGTASACSPTDGYGSASRRTPRILCSL